MNPEQVLHLKKINIKQFLLCIYDNYTSKTRTG